MEIFYSKSYKYVSITSNIELTWLIGLVTFAFVGLIIESNLFVKYS